MTSQPMPCPGQEDVLPEVVQRFNRDILARDRQGRITYGRGLQTWNGRDAGQDAWEELLDALQYLCQLQLEYADLVEENRVLREDNARLRDDVARLGTPT